MNDRETVLKQLEQAFGLLSAIPVRGDDVERLAAARTALRLCYQTIKGGEG